MSWRSLAGRPRRAALTVAGIAGGVALLFATLAINSTLHASIDTSVRGLAGEAELEVSSAARVARLTPRTVRIVEQTPGVEAAVPIRRTTTTVVTAEGRERISVFAVSRGITALLGGELGSAGRQIEALEGQTLLMGPEAPGGRRRGGGAPDRMETPTGFRRLASTEPLARAPFDDLNGGVFALMELGAADAVFSGRRRYDSIYVAATPGTQARALGKRIERRLRGRALVGPPGSQSLPYRRTYDSLAQLTDLAVAASLWVAFFVVLNSISISMLERRRSISLSFALGATQRQVAVALLVEAVLVGLVGGVLGVLGGYLLADVLLDRSVEAYPLLPVTTSGTLFVSHATLLLALASGPAIAVAGALLPVRRVLRAAPIDALRIESPYEWDRLRRERASRRPRRALAGAIACVLAIGLGTVLGSMVDAPLWLGGASLLLVLTGGFLLLPLVLPTLVGALRLALRRSFGVLGTMAADSLRRNLARTTLTVGVLALSSATAIGLGTALGSFESDMTDTFTERYGAPLYVTSRSYSGITSDQPMPGRTAAQLREVAGVGAVYPLRYRPLNIDGSQAIIASAPLVRQTRDGIPTALAGTEAPSQRALLRGLAKGGIVPSRYTAERHDLRIGRNLVVPGPNGDVRLPVVGIFDDVLSVDSLYMEHSRYAELAEDTDIDHFAIAAAPGVSPTLLEARLKRALAEQRIHAVVQTREEVVDGILSNVRGMFSIARGLQLAALLIAGLVVANTMLTVVMERRWEFSLSRTLGMASAQVRRVVLLEALGIGLIGAFAAAVMGIGIGFLMLSTMEMRFSWTIERSPQWGLMAGVLAAGVLGAIAASLPPASMAARAPIAETLRAE